MFLGNKFCGRCGGAVQEAKPLDGQGSGDCPRCKIALEVLEIGDSVVQECGRCGGFWLAADAFDKLCASTEQQSSVLGFVDSFVLTNTDPPKISYVPCPSCRKLMNRTNFARSSGVIIDTCKQHGVWFDAAELPRILEFIQKGGLARQREKEKIALEDERARLRDERRRIEMLKRRTGGQFLDE